MLSHFTLLAPRASNFPSNISSSYFGFDSIRIIKRVVLQTTRENPSESFCEEKKKR